MDATIDRTYTVALCDYAELPLKERTAAEMRYAKALERRLGTPDDVAHALKAVTRLSEDGGESSPEAVQLMRQWRLATDAARLAAFQGLGESHEAWFDLRLA